MKRRSFVGLAMGAVALATTVTAGAQAAPNTTSAATAACQLGLGSITNAGAQTSATVTAGKPPTIGKPTVVTGVYPFGPVRAASTFQSEPNVAGFDLSGYVVLADALYLRYYNRNAGIDQTTRIGGGWTNFTNIEYVRYEQGKTTHTMFYGLRNDGTLFRWNAGGKSFVAAGSAPGFAAVKSMTLISKTATYDTFLANTRGGALYTIRIPISSPMKPIVKAVRTGTWQGFETLVAGPCGQYGTVVLGIDKDSKSGYLYAVGHANGTATVINSLGKVSGGTFADPIYHRVGPVDYLDRINGD
ncbi:hypothetical protein [Kribbella sp.]|uniref:hypothetical protein n=1 Tax=Kribbella sp. TaxID=1871183 RepID=UPI002D351090|nr:hypothetical protein [Kribbella sp.]HZX06582.1 hypothetical protein [Kribbella sp.]